MIILRDVHEYAFLYDSLRKTVSYENASTTDAMAAMASLFDSHEHRCDRQDALRALLSLRIDPVRAAEISAKLFGPFNERADLVGFGENMLACEGVRFTESQISVLQ